MKIVVTEYKPEDVCKCQLCDKIIAQLTDDAMAPSAEECYKSGNVPIPNFGWFCSQDCASNYEKKYDTKFARTIGRVDFSNTEKRQHTTGGLAIWRGDEYILNFCSLFGFSSSRRITPSN